jgi:nucleoside-diphosphate-sugar epimerase
MERMSTIIVTGSTGLVGSALVAHLARQGFQVRAFQRVILVDKLPNISYHPFDLKDIRDEGFSGADYIVHCAYQPVVSKEERESGASLDESAAHVLIGLARKYGIKIIFLSSTSAHADAHSWYARTKANTEKLFDTNRDLVLRLGLVIGGTGGLFGRLQANLRRFKIIPLLGGGRQRVQVLNLGDLCKVVEEAIRKNISGVYNVAHPGGVSMLEIYTRISEAMGVRPYFISVPLSLAYGATRALEGIGVKLPFTSENILGLKDLRIVDVRPYFEQFEVPLSDWRATLRNR